jgi:hypothetical protein
VLEHAPDFFRLVGLAVRRDRDCRLHNQPRVWRQSAAAAVDETSRAGALRAVGAFSAAVVFIVSGGNSFSALR